MEKRRNLKIVCVLMSVLLVFTMMVPHFAYADGNHNIIINNTVAGKVYSAYQLFSKDGNDYVIDSVDKKGSANPFYAAIETYNNDPDTDDNAKLTLTLKAEGTTTYIVTVGNQYDENDAARLSDIISNAVADWTNLVPRASTTATGTPTTITGLPDGYYVVRSTLGNTLALVTLFGEDVTFDEKNSSQIGQISFDIVRSAVGYAEETDVVTRLKLLSNYDVTTQGSLGIKNYYCDQIPTGSAGTYIVQQILKYRGSFNTMGADGKPTIYDDIEVYYKENPTSDNWAPGSEDVPLVIDEDYKIENWDPSPDGTQPTLAIHIIDKEKEDNAEYTWPNGAMFYVCVKAKAANNLDVVNNDGTSTINNATNGKVDHVGTGSFVRRLESGWAEESTDTDSFRVLGTSLAKYDSKATKGTILEGAKFSISRTAGGEPLKFIQKGIETNGVQIWATTDAANGETEIPVGSAMLYGFGDGQYYLTETQAPAGYNMLTAPVPMIAGKLATVGTSQAYASNFHEGFSYDKATKVVSYDPSEEAMAKGNFVANSQGIVIPGTGGIGTIIFIVIGFLSICGGVIYCVTRRKFKHNKVIIEK